MAHRNFPSEEEFWKIACEFSWRETFDLLGGLLSSKQKYSSDEIYQFTREKALQDWVEQAQVRLTDVRFSFVLMNYYRRQYAGEDPGLLGEGPDASVKAELQQGDADNLGQYRYFVENFYMRLLSMWEIVGQIVICFYEAQTDGLPSFLQAMKWLRTEKPELCQQLNRQVLRKTAFRVAKTWRNDIAHNFLPGYPGGRTKRFTEILPDGRIVRRFSFGVGRVTPSASMLTNAVEALKLLSKTIELVKVQLDQDRDKIPPVILPDQTNNKATPPTPRRNPASRVIG